jgi:hypothetical protein
MIGLWVGSLFEHCDHLPTLEPSWREPNVVAFSVNGEEHTDVCRARAQRMQGLMKFDVVGKERAQAVPVTRVEQRDVAGHRSGRSSHVGKRVCICVDLSKSGATARQMPFHGIDRDIEQTGDFGQRLVEHVLENNDAALEDRKFRKARHRSFLPLLGASKSPRGPDWHRRRLQELPQ